MDEFEICILSESENKTLDYDVFDNYYKVRSKYGYHEELNYNIRKEMEAILNGLLITENDYNKEKYKNEELQLNYNKLLNEHNKLIEENQQYKNKLDDLQLNYNKLDELVLNLDRNFEYKNIKRKLDN
jgi:hypothetical protein